MLQYTRHQDPKPECAEIFDSMGPDESAYSFHNPVWTSLDPHFGSENLYQDLECYNWEKQHQLSIKTAASATYDRAAHGFGLTVPITLAPQQLHHSLFKQQHQSPDDNLYTFGLTTSWHGHETEDYRHMRYVSPTDGGSLISSSSASDSAFSDDALSPDGMRSAATMASFPVPPLSGESSRWTSPVVVNSVVKEYTRSQQRYPSTMQSEYPYSQSHSRTSTTSASVLHSSLPPALGLAGMESPTACSMKELQLQYTPDAEEAGVWNDTDIDIMMMEDNEVIRIKVHEPEEVALREGRVFDEEVEGDCVGEADVEGDERDADGESEEEEDDAMGEEDDDAPEGNGDGEHKGNAPGETEYETPLPDALSEVDPDFSPTSHATKNPRTSVRTSARTPKQTKPRAVHDEGVRVHKLKSKPKQKKKPHSRTTTASSSHPSSKPTPSSNTSRSSSKPLYPCPFHPFHCPAQFPSKNEWKRHTLSQHLQLGFYRCDLGVCHEGHVSGETRRRGYNDFNRRDLFVQHLRRMHARDYDEEVGGVEGSQLGSMGAEGGEVVGGGKGKGSGGKKVAKGRGNARGKGSRMPKSGEKEDFEKWIEQVRGRCWVKRRETPEWCVCGVCGKTFGDDIAAELGQSHAHAHAHPRTSHKVGGGKDHRLSISLGIGKVPPKEKDAMMVGKAWEEKMEHVARHYEREGVTAGDEEVDEGLRDWALREGLISERGVLVALEEKEDELEEEDGEGGKGKRSGRRGRGRRRGGGGGGGGHGGGYRLRDRVEDEEDVDEDSEEEEKEEREEEEGLEIEVLPRGLNYHDDEDDEDDTDAEGEDE